LTSSARADLPDASLRLSAVAPGILDVIRVFPEGTKTAADAAAAIGCPVAAIVKSLVFVLEPASEAVIALVPGDLQLDPERLAALAGASSARRATLEEVREATGYAAGGTPPFGHARQLRVFADHRLRRNDPVWAAAGTPTTVFPVSLADLDDLAAPEWVDVSRG
jgi:prolyl-tRNA editing enzyme YbaK/EbsC (Cys-tRNA(Pro) deacylase)